MTDRNFDTTAEQLIGKIAKHARHSSASNVLQTAKKIAYIFTEMMFDLNGDHDYYNGINDAIARVCPEEKILEEFKIKHNG